MSDADRAPMTTGDPHPAEEAAGPGPAHPPAPSGVPARRPRRLLWLTPGGISAIAAVAALVLTAVGLILQARASTTAPPAAGPVAAQEAPALFVYGSSMPGMSRYREISEYVTRSARDTVQGQLYDSGLGYPMARFGGEGELHGFVLWLDPDTADAALAEMTRLESGLFHPTRVRTLGGVTAQGYEWIGSTDGYPRIDTWDGSTEQYGQQLPWPELAVGDCYQPDTDENLVVTIWCGAPHAYEAYHTAALDQADGGVHEAAQAQCADAFADFVGIPPEESALVTRVWSSPPSATDPRVLCGVGSPGVLEVGTLAQSKR